MASSVAGSSDDLKGDAVVPEVEVAHDDPPVEVPVAVETLTVTGGVGSGPNLGGDLTSGREFPPDGISLKLVAKVASSRRPMDGLCLAEIAEMALNDRIFSRRQLTGSRKRELDPLNPPCDGTVRLCRELVRDNFMKHGLISGQAMRVDVRVVVGRIDVGACPVVVMFDMTGFDMLTQVALFLATGYGVPPLPFKVVLGEGETGVEIDLGAKLVDTLRIRQEVLVYCNPPVHVRSPAGDSTRGQPVRGEVPGAPAGSVRQSGEGSTAQGSDSGEVGVGFPSEPWGTPLSVGDLAAFTPQGQQSIHYLKSVFGQVSAAVFHVKLPDDRDLAFDIAQIDGSIAVLVHRIALEMKQSVSMFGSPSHAGWHLQVKDSIETDGATIFLLAFTFLHPGSVVEPVQGKMKRRRSPSPGSKPSGSRPVFGGHSQDKSRRVRSKRTTRGGNQGGDGSKGTRGRITAGAIGFETGDLYGKLDHPMVDELEGDELHVSRFFGYLTQHDDFDSEAAVAFSEAIGANGCEEQSDGLQDSNVGCIGHGMNVFDFLDSKGQVSPTLPFNVVADTGIGFSGARELKGEAEGLCVLLPIVKACVDTNTFIDQAKTVVCTEDTWVAVPESYIGALPQRFRVCEVRPSFPFPRSGPLFLPQDLAHLASFWTEWIAGTSGTGVGHFRFRMLEGILGGKGLLWKVQFQNVFQGEDIGFVFVHSCYQNWASFEVGQEFSALFCGLVAVFQGLPVVGVGPFGPSRSLIRRWTKEEQSGPHTLLELYAGIGGWSAGFGQLSDAVVVSVEWDKPRAVALAASKNVPWLTIDEVNPEHVGTSFVLIADVTDLSWLHVSLACPFRFLCWSSPCISWSLGGKGLGLDCPEGLLMCCTVGLASLLGPQVELGENVASVLGHPHWKTVQAFAVLTEAGCYRTVISRLQRLVPMVRDRLLLVRGVGDIDLPELKLMVDPAFWLLDEGDVGKYCVVTEAERSMFADRSYLPASLLCKAPSYLSPKDVLRLRLVDPRVLPTLVASYRIQTSLDSRHLRLKGVFTWLLDSCLGPRFADAFEMAWVMGFGPELCLPADEALAMHCVGNCIAPAQALQVFWAVLSSLGLSVQGPSFGSVLSRLILGKPPLCRFSRHVCDTLWVLSLVDCAPPLDTKGNLGLFVGGHALSWAVTFLRILRLA